MELRPKLSSTKLVTAAYEFFDQENRLMLDWLLSDNFSEIRYNLASYLLDKRLQREYRIIIIDAPPRLTTGFVNALCASTHLLIPSILDRLSTQAVTNLLAQMRALKPDLFPSLELLGVVPTMVSNSKGLTARESRVLDSLREGGAKAWGADFFVFENQAIPRRAAIANAAGVDVAFLQDDDVRGIFSRFGEAIEQRLSQHRKL
jgi:chromosome partitioning protein